jgi:hypothetical protein
LIVRDYFAPPPRALINVNGNKKDFKRFRKNHILRGFTSFDADPCHDDLRQAVRLVAVLPKETERQRQLEMQQAELEREQEFADALFNDGGGGGAGGKKRGRSGGSIAGFFTQGSTATKRGRGR